MSVPTAADVQATYAATLVDEWVRGGVTDAVVCPGSRSTPLALALAERLGAVHVRLDERSGGFYALGLALATGRPPVVCTTSGTAAAELHASVIEAHHAGVPVLVCTADRPPELQAVGAPQTIDQAGLYGDAPRWSASPGVADAAAAATWRSLAARAVVEAVGGPRGPGPVHLNLAFREPLGGRPGALPPGRPGGAPWHRVLDGGGCDDGAWPELASWVGRRGVVVAGAGAGPPAAVLGLAARLGWPVLADPRSGCRCPDPHVVASADGFLRSPAVAAALRPDTVLRLGAPWASKVLGGFLADAASAGAECTVVDPWWSWRDPDRTAATTIRADPAAWLRGALARLDGPPGHHGRAGWLAAWQAVEAAAQAATENALPVAGTPAAPAWSEPAIARVLLDLVPATATVVVSSSMPVRDLEWFAPPRADLPLVLANRGANGIDGVCSTALGAAAARRGPVVGLVGDLAFLHDVSCLVQPRHGWPAGASCTLLVLDNGGGGIFSFLAQAAEVEAARFESLFGTPQTADVGGVARGFGLPVATVTSTAELAAALADGVGRPALSVVHAVMPGRRANVAAHARVHEAVTTAAEAALTATA